MCVCVLCNVYSGQNDYYFPFVSLSLKGGIYMLLMMIKKRHLYKEQMLKLVCSASLSLCCLFILYVLYVTEMLSFRWALDLLKRHLLQTSLKIDFIIL